MSDLVEMAEELKHRGMSLAVDAQDAKSPCWSDRAYDALVTVAKLSPTVHVDDFLRAFADKPVHPNAFGAIWHRAVKAKVIVHSGRVMPSRDVVKHRHNSPIYNSLIYRRAS